MTEARVIINADDLGLVAEIDSAVERAHRAGTVTSATLIVNGRSVENAASMALRNPELGVGLHINLVWGRPLAPHVTSLVDATGTFHHRTALAARALTRRIQRSDVDREIGAQLDRLRSLGVRPTHIDAHQHAQVIPVVSAAVADLARAERLPVRVPLPRWRDVEVMTRLAQRSSLAVLCLVAQRSGLRPATTEFTSIFDDPQPAAVTGSRYVAILRGTEGATLELMVHPSDESPTLAAIHPDLYPVALAEARALLEPGLRAALEATGARLISFRDIR